jgi:hypothetical protein
VRPVTAGSPQHAQSYPRIHAGTSRPRIWVSKMSIPLKATDFHTTERMLELALALLDTARREPANNWLTNNFSLEIIRAKVAANKANALINGC